MPKRLGRNDIIFLAAVFFAVLIILAFFYLRSPAEGGYVQVTVDGEEYGNYPLSADAVIEITDGDGVVTNVLEISNGKAKMTEADCPDRLCMHQKAISLDGENIVCLPNRVVATVRSSEDSGLDTIAQ